jgi:hypothetical protein
MEKLARDFLRKMVRCNGFIADGVTTHGMMPKLWHSNSHYSSSLIRYDLFEYMRKNRLIVEEPDGRFLITNHGRKFIRPWYKRWFELA